MSVDARYLLVSQKISLEHTKNRANENTILGARRNTTVIITACQISNGFQWFGNHRHQSMSIFQFDG